MFFNQFLIGLIRPGRHQKALLLAGLILLRLICPFSTASETVDSIAALVNEEVITLSDLRIVEALGLYEVDASSLVGAYAQILEKLINQKLVIGLTRDEIPVGHPDLKSVMAEINKMKEPGEFEAILKRFGLNEEDVLEYIHEKILFERIIDDRFGLAVVVRLAEIENHYENVYVPQRESKGLEPMPMLDIIDEIETAIRNERIETRVGEWLSGLKREADIQILIQRREKE